MESEILEGYERLEDIRTLFREYAASLNVDLCFQGFEDELQKLPGRYEKPGGRLYLAKVEGEIAGCIALRGLEDGRCEMKRLYVRPRYRALGLGRALAERVIRDARAIGYREMVLDTLTQMAGAQALYEKLGFSDIPPYYPNPLPGARYMGLTLQVHPLVLH
jgi:ribosomal protein S18 acetylase RimI-like enzyme